MEWLESDFMPVLLSYMLFNVILWFGIFCRTFVTCVSVLCILKDWRSHYKR